MGGETQVSSSNDSGSLLRLMEWACEGGRICRYNLFNMDWKVRIDRINRLKEKGEFDRVVMPVSYVGMGIGILVLGWQGITVLADGKSDVVALVGAGVVIVLPGLLTLFRYFRGHFSKRLIA